MVGRSGDLMTGVEALPASALRPWGVLRSSPGVMLTGEVTSPALRLGGDWGGRMLTEGVGGLLLPAGFEGRTGFAVGRRGTAGVLPASASVDEALPDLTGRSLGLAGTVGVAGAAAGAGAGAGAGVAAAVVGGAAPCSWVPSLRSRRRSGLGAGDMGLEGGFCATDMNGEGAGGAGASAPAAGLPKVSKRARSEETGPC